MTLERGELLNNRYRIVEIIGSREKSNVYLAFDEDWGINVVLKENVLTADEFVQQFRLGAIIPVHFPHPNLPCVRNYFTVDDHRQYIIMDYIEGENLRQRIERLGNLIEDDVIFIGATLCDVLTHLHSRKPSVLHRNIKPENIMITPQGEIFLVGFGLAKILYDNPETEPEVLAITPGYSHPEQNDTVANPRTDIYSLGATLYTTLCGASPEDGSEHFMKRAVVTPLIERNPEISVSLAQVVEKAMSIEPKDRFQSAEDLKQALLLEKRSPVLPQKLNVRNIFSWLSKK